MSESGRPNRTLMPLCLAAAAFLSIAPETRAQDLLPQRASAFSGSVNVAPPTGEKEEDRASILAALEAVRPGGTVQFAPGTYLVGELIRVTTSGITLLGHPDGTTLRGCHPGDFVEVMVAGFACNGLELEGGRLTVRDLTFEYAWHGLFIGCCFPADLAEMQSADGPPHRHNQPGGHLIEGNTFRSSSNGMRVVGRSAESIVIRGNRFINTFHALVINGGTAHFLDNDISTPDPAAVPIQGRNGGAIIVMPDPPLRECGENIIADNRIVDYADAIRIFVADPGARCQLNVVRANTIVVRRNPLGSRRHAITMGSPSDTTVVGIPLAITNGVSAGGSSPGDAVVGDHLIEGNRIIGADGLGIEIRGSSGNRIVDNHLSGIAERHPFPGNTTHSMDPEAWRDANGSGIWISAGSDENEVLGNVFEDIAASAVVLEGDSNRVELQNAGDAVRDLGTGNRISGPGGPAAAAAPPLYESRFAEANGIRLQYTDFGGSGLPLIFAQDIHNYFEWEDPFQRDLHSAFYARFTDDHRVLAPVKRGYGESDDPGSGYDVATHSEDLLGLMDALGIRRAVLVGRPPATQDLTWIAEHHPERVAGLVYLGNPVVIRSSQHPEARLFDENYARGSCDLQERGIALVGARTSWRPHFLDDETVRIDVPALRFTHPEYARRSMELFRLDRLDAIAAWEPGCPGLAQSLEYFRALAADPARRAALREALEASDLSVPIDEGIEHAFGASMRTVVETNPWEGGLPAFHDFIEPHLRRFLEKVARVEADRSPAPPTGLQRRE